jgi:hypothetical protein
MERGEYVALQINKEILLHIQYDTLHRMNLSSVRGYHDLLRIWRLVVGFQDKP